MKLLELDLGDTHDTFRQCEAMERDISLLSIKIQAIKILSMPGPTTSHSKAKPPIKLESLKIPKFNGEILQWATFWDLFKSTVHQNEGLSGTENLTYLRQAVEASPAFKTIESVSSTGEDYEVAVRHLMQRFHSPELYMKRM